MQIPINMDALQDRVWCSRIVSTPGKLSRLTCQECIVLDVPKRYTRTSLTVMFVTDLIFTLQDIIGSDDPQNGRHEGDPLRPDPESPVSPVPHLHRRRRRVDECNAVL
jgi:hypothetical protein